MFFLVIETDKEKLCLFESQSEITGDRLTVDCSKGNVFEGKALPVKQITYYCDHAPNMPKAATIYFR